MQQVDAKVNSEILIIDGEFFSICNVFTKNFGPTQFQTKIGTRGDY